MSCCLPTHNVGYCPEDTCQHCTVPTYAFPDQARFGAATLQQCMSANGVLSSASTEMRHNQPFVLVGGTYYEFNGANFLHLATQERIGFTPHPIFPLSEAFFFRASKYPLTGTDISLQGQVPYASSGEVIREGDLVFLSAQIGGHVLSQPKPPSPFSLPAFIVPAHNAIQNFNYYGTQAPECMRIVSADYDSSVPPDQQPPVRLDGSKAYFFQFTRVGQSLQVLPGATPAPCVVRTSEHKGDSTRLIPLSAVVLYNIPTAPQQQQQPAANNGQQQQQQQPAANNASMAPTAEQIAEQASNDAQQLSAAAQNAAEAAKAAAKNGNTQEAQQAAAASNNAAQISGEAAQVAANAARAANSAKANQSAAAANAAAQRANGAAQAANNAVNGSQ